MPKNKIMLITGGSRGIGAATAVLAAEQGYAICVNYRSNRTAAGKVIAGIQARATKAIAVQADVSSEQDVFRLFETIDRELGALTALVNNAAILDKLTRLENINFERMQRIFATNITGSFLCAREAVKRMSTRQGGSGGAIVNVSSAASRLGSPNEFIDYAASKGAIDTLTIGLAKEVADEGIRVNAVRPGLILTDMHGDSGDAKRPARLSEHVPMKRPGYPEEVAKAILWLLSEQSSYCTGTFIEVTGGR